MLDDRILTFDPAIQRGLTTFIREHFAREDAALVRVRENTARLGLPVIQVRPEEGQILHFLARLIGARRILEIGTLAGYSGIWLARALPKGGRLVTLELDPRHAQIARQHFALAGVADHVEVIEGDAQTSLARLSDGEPFDMAFIDADKLHYPTFVAWCMDHVRPGGLITAHNAFKEGSLIAPDDQSASLVALRTTLHTLATDPRLLGTIIPVGDGLAAALVR